MYAMTLYIPMMTMLPQQHLPQTMSMQLFVCPQAPLSNLDPWHTVWPT